MARIVNIRYRCCGYNFDAAVDCDYQLHCYAHEYDDKVVVELYCFDHPEWDVYWFFYDGQNDQRKDRFAINHSVVDMGVIKSETRKWVKQMAK